MFALLMAAAAAATPRPLPAGHAALDAQIEKGITLSRQGQSAEASAVWQKALAGAGASARSRARDTAHRLQSADALLQLARIDAKAGDAAGATLSLRRALELAPSSEEALSAYAQLMLGLRSYLKALQVLDPLTRMCPADAQYHYMLGVALLQAGDMPRAVDYLQKAEELEPGRPLTLVALGIALNEQKRYDEARPLLERALEREPENVEALAVLAAAEEGLGELARAEAHIDRVIAAAPSHHTANLVKGLIQMKQAHYPAARDALEKAVAANPTSKAAHYQLSLAYARLGDDARSQKHLELYRRVQRETEERVLQIRREAGAAPPGGMGH